MEIAEAGSGGREGVRVFVEEGEGGVGCGAADVVAVAGEVEGADGVERQPRMGLGGPGAPSGRRMFRGRIKSGSGGNYVTLTTE